MMTEARELEHLRLADAHIADAQKRLERQRALIARFIYYGRDVTLAESVLQTMTDSLAVMEDHRQLLVREVSASRQRRGGLLE